MSELLSFGSRVALVVLLLCTASCSWLFGDEGVFRDRADIYRSAKLDPVLEIPGDLDDAAIDDSFVIPHTVNEQALVGEFEVPRPEPLVEDFDAEKVRIQRLAGYQWILVDFAPGQVWPRLRGFLSLNSMSVAHADAVTGIVETAWQVPVAVAGEATAESSLKERYRFRIESGVQRDSSEIYITQADQRAGEQDWPDRSSAPPREDDMVGKLAQFLANGEALASVSMLAQQGIGSAGKVVLKTDADGTGYIRLGLPLERAWASLERALEKSGYTVQDRDRSKRVYYATYEPPVEAGEQGFFAGMFGDDDDDGAQIAGVEYFIRMEQVGEQQVNISIARQDGTALPAEDVEYLLQQIKGHLS